MKKIGFICEGEADSIVLNSETFLSTLNKFKLERIRVIEAGGNGNLLPKNIQEHIQTLRREQAEVIVVTTDLDEDPCFTTTKKRINAGNLLPANSQIIVAAKSLESWFLADSTTLSSASVFNKEYIYENPENIIGSPFDSLGKEFKAHFGRGTGPSKVKFAKWFVEQGFSIESAANHKNCNSAKYFLNKLKEISEK